MTNGAGSSTARDAARRVPAGDRGSIPVMVAIAAIPLVVLCGLAADAARLWLVQSRLQMSLDAAALVAAREVTMSSGNSDAIALFWANFGRGAGKKTGPGYLGAVATTPVFTQIDSNTMQIATQATVATTFMKLVGINSATATASATAARATYGMELSMVLDNTGSMAGWPIQSVIASATSLVNIVYGSKDTQPNLWVAVAPFTAEVNIGPAHAGWLAAGSLIPLLYQNATWMGCVMARYQDGNDFTDATPGQAPFTPFLYSSTKGKYAVKGTVVTGDNDWTPTAITEASQATLPENTAVGPNLGCPPQPVLPLTASKSAVLKVISQMAAVYRGGTFINLGLQAGWWTLSPNWRGLWGSPTLPLAYNTPFMSKVIVLMTDGNNEWYDWNGGAPGVGPSPWVNDRNTDFAAYGRLSQNLMGLANNTASNATTNINTYMSQMCTLIKRKGIIVYAVLFNHSGVSASTEQLFQTCASSPQNYFLAPTDADLRAAFQQIGTQLANLRLSQ